VDSAYRKLHSRMGQCLPRSYLRNWRCLLYYFLDNVLQCDYIRIGTRCLPCGRDCWIGHNSRQLVKVRYQLQLIKGGLQYEEKIVWASGIGRNYGDSTERLRMLSAGSEGRGCATSRARGSSRSTSSASGSRVSAASAVSDVSDVRAASGVSEVSGATSARTSPRKEDKGLIRVP
jgi:hypothetical protein